MWLRMAVTVLVGFPPAAARAERPLRKFDFRQREMGVQFRISVYAPAQAAANAAAKGAFARIRQLNGLFSDYDENSELMRLCRDSGPGKPVKVSPELLAVLQHAVKLSRRTDGAFDVTVGHLTRLWRRARRRKEMPKADDLKAALSKTGYRFVRIDEKRGTVELLKPGMRLDLGGIAKGYAADEALKVLRKRGLPRAMIDASGDIVAGDLPPGKRGWTIGIAPLQNPDGKSIRYLTLANCAVATSGDAYQYVVIDGRRYSHIVDPKTGLGLTQRSSVTVIARTGTTADSLASAVSVLGPAKGLAFAAGRQGVEASVTILRNGKPVTLETCGFRSAEVNRPSR